MNVTGVTLDEFTRITDEVSVKYNGNVIVHQDAHPVSRNRITARLRVNNSREIGARLSWSGRRTVSACWHAYRDVLAELFAQYPNAKVTTSMARYDGVQGFNDNYPQTAWKNIGSQFSPVTMPELCDCGH